MTVLVAAEPSIIAQAKHRPASLVHAPQSVAAAWPSRDETPGPEQ
jgi:hypothetical protein